jgi:hypothetical protein
VIDFIDWAPRRIHWPESRPVVDWARLDARRFTDPFYGQTMDRCVRHPADVLFRPQTPLEALGEIAGTRAGLRPTGFIFHMSRCGSTLIAQMLAAAPGNIVLSEPAPIDQILRAPFRDGSITDHQRVEWLQWLVNILSWRRHPAEKNVFIKFDSWHTMFLPLIQCAFPGVPWIFVYRDPQAVIASHRNHCGAHMIPGVLEPALFGWTAGAIREGPADEYGVRVLTKICAAALAEVKGGHGKLVNYQQLPEAVWPALMKFWRAEFTGEETSRMLSASKLDAKNPVLPFERGPATHRPGADGPRTSAQCELEGIYHELESQRAASGFIQTQ